MSTNRKMWEQWKDWRISGKTLKESQESVNERWNPNKIKSHTSKAINFLKQAQSFARQGQKGAVWNRLKDAGWELKQVMAFTESVNEAVEPAGNMRKIQHIVKSKTAMKVGGTIIDMQSASLLMKLYDKVSDKDKEKMNKLNAKMLTTVIKRLWSRVNLKLPM